MRLIGEMSVEARLAELRPYVEKAKRMKGWSIDMQRVNLGPETPWSYNERARELLSGARVVLDMGTGGGERFSRICGGFDGRAVATEAWPPNVPVAAARLTPLGISVLHTHGLCLPLADDCIDLVVNRHEELDPADVARVLAPGGRMLTQQIGRNYWQELTTVFPGSTPGSEDLFQTYRDGFREAGLGLIDAREHDQKVAYDSLGDIVYMLTISPWEVPDFDLERDIDALLALESDCRRDEGVVLTHSNFIIEAEKP